jgi:molybdenum cofactor cytidylyltransferase
MDPAPDHAPGTAGVTVAVVLAAGAGSRFAGPHHKLATELDGVPLLTRVVRVVLDAAVGAVVLVTGAHEPELPAEVAARISTVPNPDWQLGQITSVRTGIDAARRLGADAVVIGLGDQPFVSPEAWRAVAASSSPIAVATYDGQRGHPVRLHASVWPLLPTRGDEGARAVIRLRPDLVEAVPCPGSADDIDTLEDLQRWQNNS